MYARLLRTRRRNTYPFGQVVKQVPFIIEAKTPLFGEALLKLLLNILECELVHLANRNGDGNREQDRRANLDP